MIHFKTSYKVKFSLHNYAQPFSFSLHTSYRETEVLEITWWRVITVVMEATRSQAALA